MEDYNTHGPYSLKEEIGRLFIVSFGVFLFVLFFQPFPQGELDYNNRLLFDTGFGAITFALACIVLIIVPAAIPAFFVKYEGRNEAVILQSAALLLLNTTAFAFYIRYVGNAPLSLFIVFKVALVCLFPIVLFTLLNKNKSLELEISSLQEQIRFFSSKLRESEKEQMEGEISFMSDNKTDKLSLQLKQIIAIKSADNYIEVHYLQNDEPEKRLIRSTLKNIELQLAQHESFIRCHRTGIVNIRFINKLVKNYSGYFLKMNNFEERIPVSRQYLMHIREVVSGVGRSEM